jgi:hypothetical protein
MEETMTDEKKKMIAAFAKNNIELMAYAKAMQHADDAQYDAMAAHVDELLRQRFRIMGLSEEEIARIEQESEAAVNEQIADEIKQFLAGAKARGPR